MANKRYLKFEGVKWKPDARALLYPAHVWKVIYPKQRRLPLNVFQQAIMGLARARCRESTVIAELLCLDAQLVAFIVGAQLIPNGWMNGDGSLTENGKRVLEETEDFTEEMVVGYAYQDGITGKWLPRFSESLPEIEPSEFNKNGDPVFLRSRDEGKKDYPFFIPNLNECGVKTDLTEIFEAYKCYRSDCSFSEHNSDEELEDGIDRLHMDGFSYAEEVSQPMWLWTWIFPDKGSLHPWIVADPFGLQPAVAWLRKPLKQFLQSNDRLAKYIAPIIDGPQIATMSAAEWIHSIETTVDFRIRTDFSWLDDNPEITDHLSRILYGILRLEDHDGNQADWNSIFNECNMLIERMFKWMLTRFPVNTDFYDKPTPDKIKEWKDTHQNKIHLSNIDKNKIVSISRSTINQLSSQDYKKLWNAFTKQNQPLKTLILASIFSSVEHKDHPLRIIDVIDLDYLIALTNRRNEAASHAGEDNVTKEEAIDAANKVLGWVNLFKEHF